MESRRHIATLSNIVSQYNTDVGIIDIMDGRFDFIVTFSELAYLFAEENAIGVAYRHRVAFPSLKQYVGILQEEAVDVDFYQALIVIQGYEAQVLERNDWEKTGAYILIKRTKQNLIDEILELQNVAHEYYKL